MLRFGILSTARIAREHVMPAIHRSGEAVVTAVASRDGARARALAQRFGVPLAFGSYDELLACGEIDAVYVPLPTAHHVDWAVRAANAGKHVLVEKPLALSADDVARVIEARDAAGVVVQEAFMVLHHPQWEMVRDFLRRGRIGPLRRVQGAFAYHNLDPSDMRNRPELGGGALPDIGVYPVVTTRFVTGAEPTAVRAEIRRDPVFGTDSHAAVAARFPGFDLDFYVSTQLADRQFMVFHGEDGFVEVHSPFNAGVYGDHRVDVHDRAHRAASTYRFPGVDQFVLEIDAFARAVRGEGGQPFPLEQSARNQRVIDAAYRSEASGRWEALAAPGDDAGRR